MGAVLSQPRPPSSHLPGAEAVTVMTEVLVQPDGSPGPVGERPERGVEEPEGKRPPNTGARLWGRVRSKLLRQKVPLRVWGGGWLGGRWWALGWLRHVCRLRRAWWLWGFAWGLVGRRGLYCLWGLCTELGGCLGALGALRSS